MKMEDGGDGATHSECVEEYRMRGDSTHTEGLH